jgi:hypothetical protein
MIYAGAVVRSFLLPFLSLAGENPFLTKCCQSHMTRYSYINVIYVLNARRKSDRFSLLCAVLQNRQKQLCTSIAYLTSRWKAVLLNRTAKLISQRACVGFKLKRQSFVSFCNCNAVLNSISVAFVWQCVNIKPWINIIYSSCCGEQIRAHWLI